MHYHNQLNSQGPKQKFRRVAICFCVLMQPLGQVQGRLLKLEAPLSLSALGGKYLPFGSLKDKDSVWLPLAKILPLLEPSLCRSKGPTRRPHNLFQFLLLIDTHTKMKPTHLSIHPSFLPSPF